MQKPRLFDQVCCVRLVRHYRSGTEKDLNSADLDGGSGL